MFGYILHLFYKFFQTISPWAFSRNALGSFRESFGYRIHKPLKRIGLVGIAILLLTSTVASSLLQVSSVGAKITTQEQSCAVSGGKWDTTAKTCIQTVRCPNQPVEAKGGNYIPRTGGCTPSEEAISISYLVTLYVCVAANMKGTITSSIGDGRNPPVSAMFSDSIIGANEGYVYPGAQKKSCASIMTAAMSLWGISDTGPLLESMGIYTYNAHKGDTANPEYKQTQSSGGINGYDTVRADAFKTAIQKQVYGSTNAAVSDAAQYAISYDAFTRSGKFDSNTTSDDNIAQCNAHDYGIYPDDVNNQPELKSAVEGGKSVANDKTGDYTFFSAVNATRTYTQLNVVGPDGTPSVHAYAYLSAKTYSNSTADIITSLPLLGLPLLFPKTSSDTLTHATTFGYRVNFVGTNPPACATLAKSVNKYAGAFQTWQSNNKGTVDNGVGNGACPDGSSPDANGDCKGVASSCVVDGIGWMVCPLMNALGGLNDAMYGWIESVLVLNPLSTTDKDGNQTAQYLNWAIIRNIANVLLVIAFLFIIFSQISSIGITNYGVKKMLPRVILVAIAINLSWTIMSLAVDVVNIAGIGLHTLLDSAAVSPSAQTLNSGTASASLVAGLVTGTAAVAVGTAVGLATAGLSTLVLMALPFIVGAALALLAAVATLFLRNALIIVLVIIAPVALVAYLLPNTEEYFKKWRKLFLSMLFLFPIAALLFAGAKFAAYVIVTSDQPLAQITALFVMAAPLGMLPWLARSSGGILASVNQGMGRMGKSLQGATQRGLANRVEAGKKERQEGRRTILGRMRDPNWKGGERHKENEYATDAKNNPILDRQGNKILLNRKGDFKRDAKGNPLGATRRTRRTGAQYFAEKGEELKDRASIAQKGIQSNYRQAGLGDQGTTGNRQTMAQKRAQHVAGIIDRGKVQDLRSESIDAQYKGRLEVSKLVSGESKDLYDRLQDANTTTSSLEHEQTLRQTDRIKNNAVNTAADGIGLSRLAAATNEQGDGMTENGQAERLQALASQSLEGGAGLKVLHENQERAEFATQNIDATLKSEFEKSKKVGGANADLFAESVGGKIHSAETAAELKRIEDEAAAGFNQKDAAGNQLFDQAELEEMEKAKQRTIAKGRASDQATNTSTLGVDKIIAESPEGDASDPNNLTIMAAGISARDDNQSGDLKYNPDGSVAGLEVPVAGSFSRLEADRESDKKAFRAKHIRENLTATGIYSDVLGIENIKDIDGPLKSESALALPEEMSALEEIIDNGGAEQQDDVLNYTARLVRAANQAEIEAKAAEGTPDAKIKRDEADKKRERAKVITGTVQRALASHPSSRAMQYGGSIEQRLAEAVEDRSTRELMADRLGGGKFDASIGGNNIDRLKLLESQVGSYATDTNLFDREFEAAFLPSATFNVDKSGRKFPDEASRQAAIAAELKSTIVKKRAGFADFVLTLDEALYSPSAPKLSNEKRKALEDTRTAVFAALKANGIDPPKVPTLDPATGRPATDANGDPVPGPYRKRSGGEYNPQS